MQPYKEQTPNEALRCNVAQHKYFFAKDKTGPSSLSFIFAQGSSNFAWGRLFFFHCLDISFLKS